MLVHLHLYLQSPCIEKCSLSPWVDPESIESQYKAVWNSMALAQTLTSNYTLPLHPRMLLLLVNSLYISAWDAYELRDFTLLFFFSPLLLRMFRAVSCSLIELEGFVAGIFLWFSLSQWTLLKKLSAEPVLSQRSPEDLNTLPGQLIW